jgi:uncharacterized membrane protein
MKEWLVSVTEPTIAIIDAVAFVVIVAATLRAIVKAVRVELGGASMFEKRAVWLEYARFLVVALTFQLAADIIETSISTNWEAIGRLGAIAVIRTFLEFFLGRDVTEWRERQDEPRQTARGEP